MRDGSGAAAAAAMDGGALARGWQPVLDAWLASWSSRLDRLPADARELVRTETRHLVESTLEELRVIEASMLEVSDRVASLAGSAASDGVHYRHLFEGAPVGLVVTDAAGRLREANATFVAMLGRREPLRRGHPLASLVALDDRAAFREALSRMRQEPGPFELPFTVLRRDGTRLALTAAVRVEEGVGGGQRERLLYWAASDDRRAAEDDLL